MCKIMGDGWIEIYSTHSLYNIGVIEIMDKEIRNNTLQVEVKDDSRLVEGYALVFNSLSNDLGGFYEKIEPTALDGVLEHCDVLALLDHNKDRGVLARCNKGVGSLKLAVDDKGLYYSFDAPKTALGDEVLEAIRRGDIVGSSFGFVVEDDKWEHNMNGDYIRTINKFKMICDVSAVYTPAYDATSVEVKSFDKFKAQEKREMKWYIERLRERLKNKV